MVRKFSIIEEVQINPQRMADITKRLGPDGAKITLRRAIDGLAQQLARINTALMHQNFADIHEATGLIVTISDRIGLETLENVAMNVRRLAITGDSLALAACAARLIRVSEASLFEMWGVKNMLP